MTAIDREALDAQTFGDKALASEILAMFLDQSPPLMQALGATVGRARREVAHRLKGSALAIGAGELADRAAALEAAPNDVGRLRAVEEAVAAARQDIAGLLQR
jgi:HPt (histidine-containing phosphotransfer) domain-containing protein